MDELELLQLLAEYSRYGKIKSIAKHLDNARDWAKGVGVIDGFHDNLDKLIDLEIGDGDPFKRRLKELNDKLKEPAIDFEYLKAIDELLAEANAKLDAFGDVLKLRKH